MKVPKHVGFTLQDALNLGLNGFALTLIAESFADQPEKFGDSNVLVKAEAHNKQEVWILLSKTMPKPTDFDAEF